MPISRLVIGTIWVYRSYIYIYDGLGLVEDRGLLCWPLQNDFVVRILVCFYSACADGGRRQPPETPSC